MTDVMIDWFRSIRDERILTIEHATKGYSHQCIKITTSNGVYAVKQNTRKQNKDAFLHEIKALELATQHNLKTPMLLAYDDQTYMQLLTWLDGKDASETIHLLEDAEQKKLAYSLGQTMASMHKIKNNAFCEQLSTNDTYSSWNELIQTRFQHLLTQNEQCQTIDLATLQKVDHHFQQLMNELPQRITPSFTHRDLYLPNVIVHDHELVGIIDLEAAKFYD
ncbi:aminoglycoside phosphotransferase family protein [Bacillus sp. CGMCC 1.16541]|uniref:aminoglycoside phosphotransferase family protein n=1 Tax=Bacillus sp. CGMCC 1.16541 TaxID=2185143 RepID=UPI000D73B029|nr:aminoglycoside phosphotransferase family protein [Bacillus sp. CGMCC 1.16541]